MYGYERFAFGQAGAEPPATAPPWPISRLLFGGLAVALISYSVARRLDVPSPKAKGIALVLGGMDVVAAFVGEWIGREAEKVVRNLPPASLGEGARTR